ncbi:MAG TPA: hypothetical protein VF590_17570, partial [Isosphaeraceae bacterium]
MTRLVPVRRPFLALDARRRDRRPGARAKLSVRVEPLEGRTLMSTVQDFEAPGTPSAPAQLGHGGPDWMPVAGVWNEGATTRAEAPTSPGTWGPVLPWPAVAIHAHLLPTGQVLYW